MTELASHRGEPVWVLGAIVGGWIGTRALFWQAPQFLMVAGAAHVLPNIPPSMIAARSAVAPLPAGQAAPKRADKLAMLPAGRLPSSVAVGGPWSPSSEAPLPQAQQSLALPLDSMVTPVPMAPSAGDGHAAMRPSVAAAHQLMWMAAVANLPTPQQLLRPSEAGTGAGSVSGQAADGAGLAADRASGPAGQMPPMVAMVAALAAPINAAFLQAALPPAPTGSHRRWSADGWILLRKGGVPALGSTAATYGAAQVGAVLRYRLAPASRFVPYAYARGYGAINGSGESQLALGLAARPLPAIPVRAMAEMRASRFTDGSLHWRPSVAAVSEFAPLELPLGARAELYVQGGYVGGKLATGFLDGQFKLDRQVLQLGAGRRLSGELRAGAGVWGGGQKGASRIDVGPSVSIGLTRGEAGARLAADWRFRVSGNATPTSGPALTLSAGF